MISTAIPYEPSPPTPIPANTLALIDADKTARCGRKRNIDSLINFSRFTFLITKYGAEIRAFSDFKSLILLTLVFPQRK